MPDDKPIKPLSEVIQEVNEEFGEEFHEDPEVVVLFGNPADGRILLVYDVFGDVEIHKLGPHTSWRSRVDVNTIPGFTKPNTGNADRGSNDPDNFPSGSGDTKD
jgi:hypothetical protein